MELRQCFAAKRIPVFVLLGLIGVFLVVQESELSPLVIVFFVGFAILEAQFNNILFRSPRELEALSMFPISWRRIVLLKNLATIILAAILTVLISMVAFYFAPHPIGRGDFLDALLYSATIIFPLLHVGNLESVLSPRRNVGWQTDGLVQAVGMILFVVVLSIPYVIMTTVFRLPLLCILYAIAVGWYWYSRSIPRTAATIEQKKTDICTMS